MKNSKPRLRLAVFDCDGTLVDSAHSIIACMQTACKNMGHPSPDKADIRRTVGLSVEVAITKIFPDMEINQVLSVREEFHRLFGKLRDLGGVHEPLYPGVNETLSALNDAGWLLGVATGKSSKGLKLTLTNHNLHHHFVTLQTADISIGKPDPDMLLKAIRDTGVEKKRTVMIGDTSFDMHMARNAGTLAIGVTWGYHNVEELFDSGAHGVVKTFSQLPQAIENLLRNNR
jgi:phosphoglycolate phosphatase